MKGHNHTGPIIHGDMTSLLKETGKKDPHADPQHHKMNKMHGMPKGCCGCDPGQEGQGEALGSDEEHYQG